MLKLDGCYSSAEEQAEGKGSLTGAFALAWDRCLAVHRNAWPASASLAPPGTAVGQRQRNVGALELGKTQYQAGLGSPWLRCRLSPAALFTSCHLPSLRLPRNGEGLECYRPPHRLLVQLASISGGAPAPGESCPLWWLFPTLLIDLPLVEWSCRPPKQTWPPCRAGGDT